MRVLRNLAENF